LSRRPHATTIRVFPSRLRRIFARAESAAAARTIVRRDYWKRAIAPHVGFIPPTFCREKLFRLTAGSGINISRPNVNRLWSDEKSGG
jgi:hypothetical protein